MKTCPICGGPTRAPVQAALEHFCLYLPGQLGYVRGNFRMFGFLGGLDANLSLLCPIYNTLRHWRHRRSSLTL